MIQRDYVPLIEAAKKILSFQYKYHGYQRYTCSSCGAQKYIDETDNSESGVEECSKNCPWRRLKEAIDYASQFHLGDV